VLGKLLPHDRQPIRKDLKEAEDAFRELTSAVQEELALEERSGRERDELPENA
jgi:hypothetical protein